MEVRGKSRKSDSPPISLAAASKALLEARALAKLAKAQVRELKAQLKQARKKHKRARKQLKAMERKAKTTCVAAKPHRRQVVAKQKAVARPRRSAAAMRLAALESTVGDGLEVLRPISAVIQPTTTSDAKIVVNG